MIIQNPSAVFNWIRPHIAKDVEEIWVLALNASCHLISGMMIYRGTVDQCFSHPREIFRFVLKNGASSFILVHNHPSGLVEPSREDVENTQRLILISRLIEIPLVDHVIVSDKTFLSLKQKSPKIFKI